MNISLWDSKLSLPDMDHRQSCDFVHPKEETRLTGFRAPFLQPQSLFLYRDEPFSAIGGCNVVLYVSCTSLAVYNFCVLCFEFFFFFLVHAAVIAINEAIDHRIPADTFAALRNPNAMLVNLEDPLASTYQDVLYQAKQEKMTNAKNRVKMERLFFLVDRYSFIVRYNSIFKIGFLKV